MSPVVELGMAVTVRLLVLTALVGVAGAALVAGTRGTAGGRAAAPEPGNSAVALAVLGALAAPAIVLIVVAVLRFRRAPRPAPAPGPRDARRWLGAIMLLAVLALMVGGAVLAATLARREPSEREPAPATVTPARPEPEPSGEDRTWLLAAVVVLVGLLVLAVVARRRAVVPAEDRPREAASRGAAERVPAAVTGPARDARTAIIRCYATMEGALTAVPGLAPRAADSPSEVLARAHRAGAVRSAGAWRLVELFDEARFSRHSMTEPDRTAAETSLRVILDELRSVR